MTCKHLKFAADVRVARIEDIGRFVAEIRVSCTDCGKPFQFQGLAVGMNYNGATVSLDGLEAHLPIFPDGQQPNPMQSLMGYTIKNTN